MELSVSCVTLVVPDLAAAAAFYEALGFSLRLRGPIAYLGEGAPAIALATAATLAAVGLATAPTSAILSCNLPNPPALEALFARALALGGTAIAPPHAVPYGRAAWIGDPFGHRWELVWNAAKNPLTPPGAP